MEPEEKQIIETKSEEKKNNHILPFIKKMGIFPYLRELSIVIIGILITLSITNLISDRNRQKDLDGMLSMVKQELYKNLKNLEWSQKRWDGESHIFTMLKENNYIIEAIPEDILREYQYSLGALHAFIPEKDSYEVLKNSVQSQYIKQKDLLQKLSYTYSSMEEVNNQLSTYSDQKRNYMTPVLMNMDIEDAEKALSDSPYESFNYYIKDRSYRTFTFFGPTILSEGVFENCKDIIQKVIVELEKYGY